MLIIRGRYLGDPVSVRFEPDLGIAIGTDFVASADGSQLWARFSVAPDAALGERVVRVSTPGGSSTAISSSANRLRVVEQALHTHAPITSPLLGINLEHELSQPQVDGTAAASILGVTVGPVIRTMTPRLGEVGTGLEVGLGGSGLAGIDEVSVEPPDGVTIEAITADPLGAYVRLSVLIAPDAPEVWRKLRAFSAGAEIPFATGSIARFLVTAPIPRISAVIPNTLRIGSGDQALQLRGESFSRATGVSALPPDGLHLGPPEVNAEGTVLTINMRASAGASAGPRVLRVTTPAGTSTAVMEPANTLTLFNEAQVSPDPLVAPRVGISIGGTQQSMPLPIHLPAPLIGVRMGPNATPSEPTRLTVAPSLGVAVGSFVTAVDAPPLTLGGTYDLRISGHELEVADGAGVFPGLDLAVSSPLASPSGSEVTLTLTVPADADPQPRRLGLVAGARILPFTDPADAVIRIAAGLPKIDSIQPILAEPGDTIELIVRGENLQGAPRVFAEPQGGLEIGNERAVSNDGTELRVQVHVRWDAEIGPHTIRVQAPGGTSTDAASPANTFTVY
jgi:hypothetical protein